MQEPKFTKSLLVAIQTWGQTAWPFHLKYHRHKERQMMTNCQPCVTFSIPPRQQTMAAHPTSEQLRQLREIESKERLQQLLGQLHTLEVENDELNSLKPGRVLTSQFNN